MRNSTDGRCPSPTARRLRTNRQLPAAMPDWSGWATAEGLNSAAASTANSWVNQAPTRLRRSSDRWAASGIRCAICRSAPQHTRQVAVAARVSGTDPLQGRSDVVVGQRQDPRQHARGPGPTVGRELVTGHEQPGQHSRRSGRSITSVRVTHSVTRRSSSLPQIAGQLQRREQRQSGLRALVLVAPEAFQTVVAATACSGRASACRSRCPRGTTPRRARSRRPIAVVRRSTEPRAGVGQCRDLDRLLVECRSVSPGPQPPAGTTDRCPSRVCCSSSQSSRPRPSATSNGESSAVPAARRASGQRRVRVSEPGLRPRPSSGRAQACRPHRPPRRAAPVRRVVGQGREHLRGAERGERHGARMRERRRAPRSNPASARSRRRGVRATAVPRPQSPRPQQSSTDAVSGQLKSDRRRLWKRPSDSCAASTKFKYCSRRSSSSPSVCSRQTTTNARATSSTQ